MSDLNDMEGALSQAADPWGVNNSVGNYTAPPAGPLSRTAPDIQALLAQFVPQNDSRDRYLALAAGFGSATKTGRFGESLGNVASALQDQKMQQEKLRTQYVPLIMQHVAMQDAQAEKAMKLQLMQQDLKLKTLTEKRAQGTFDMQQQIIQEGMRRMKLGQPQLSSAPMQIGAGSGAPQGGGGMSGVVPGMSGGAISSSGMGGAMPSEANNLEMLKLWAVGQVPGAKELFDIHKYENSPEELKAGSTYQNRTTGAREFIPLMEKGMLPDPRVPNGVMSQPGFSDVNAGIEGAKSSAVEGAKARLDPFTMTPKGADNPILTNRAAAMTQSQPGMMGSGFAGGSRDAANADSIQVMMAELRNPQISESDKVGIRREIAVLQKQSGMQPGGMEMQSEAEKIKQTDTAKADVVRDTTKKTDAKRYGQLTATADRALELLQSGPTASGIGSLVDSAANFVGQSTKSADAAAELTTLGGWMTANVPRMEGPQSDKDVAQYRIMAAAVGEKTLPISQRIAAAKELKLLQDKYADLNGYSAPPGDKPAKKPLIEASSFSDSEKERRYQEWKAKQK